MPDSQDTDLSTTALEAIERERFFRVTFEQAPIAIAHTGPNLEWLRVNEQFCRLLGFSCEELLSMSFMDITHPDDAEKSLEAHRLMFQGGQNTFSLEKRFFRKDGTLIWVRMMLAMVRAADGSGLYTIAMAEDITEHKQIEMAALEQRTLAEALRDTATALHSTLDLSQVLDGILASVERVVPHDSADIMLIRGHEAQVVRVHGMVDQETIDHMLRLRLTIADMPTLRQMIETRQSVIIPDVHTDSRWVQLPYINWQRSYVGVPILLHNDIIGFLNLNSTAPRFFKPEHIERLKIFAAQAATAIRNAELFEKVQELAALEERQRLARELHDGVSQALFSASIIAEAIPRLWKRDPDKALGYLEQLKSLNRSALAEMRSLLLELRPTQLLSINLVEQLPQLIQAVRGRKHVEARLIVDEQQPVPPEIQIALYRITQEALNNVVKHTHATVVEVSYSSSPDGVELSIWDNGKGFDPAQTKDGIGVETMRERADSIQASFEITSSQQNGTRVAVRWVPESKDC